MSAARFGGKWADADEDDDEGLMGNEGGTGTRFETPVDEKGEKMVIEYLEREKKTYKVTTRVKVTKVTNWTNTNITERKNMAKFGKALTNDAASEAGLCVKSTEEVVIEMTKKLAGQAIAKDDAEDKFYEDSLSFSTNLNAEKKVWTDMNRIKQLDRDEQVGVGAAGQHADENKEKTEDATTNQPAAAPGGKGATTRYVPPSLRNVQDGGKGDGKGKGKGDLAQQQEASLRITNLSEDCREGDLQDLFGQCGRLQRVYLAKDLDTGMSRGFAFITYYTREDAQKAIDKLNGHGYDNLILQVQFAKPRA